jgi:hypothetical protein
MIYVPRLGIGVGWREMLFQSFAGEQKKQNKKTRQVGSADQRRCEVIV